MDDFIRPLVVVPSSASSSAFLKPMVCSVNVPLAATASFELLGFRPAPSREPPCEPFFCTFGLFLFGDAELMVVETNGFGGFVSKKICL